MNSAFRKIAIVLPCLVLLLGAVMAAEPNEPPTDSPTVKAAVIVCEDMIDDGLYKSIRRRTQIALDRGAECNYYQLELCSRV